MFENQVKDRKMNINDGKIDKTENKLIYYWVKKLMSLNPSMKKNNTEKIRENRWKNSSDSKRFCFKLF